MALEIPKQILKNTVKRVFFYMSVFRYHFLITSRALGGKKIGERCIKKRPHINFPEILSVLPPHIAHKYSLGDLEKATFLTSPAGNRE